MERNVEKLKKRIEGQLSVRNMGNSLSFFLTAGEKAPPSPCPYDCQYQTLPLKLYCKHHQSTHLVQVHQNPHTSPHPPLPSVAPSAPSKHHT
jgi:hypothetical protein